MMVSAHSLSARLVERAAFLKDAGWDEAASAPLAGDASTRSYERLRLGERGALLMNAPPAAETAHCPADATPAERRALGYNAMARLAGPNLNAFLVIGAALRAAGLSAPNVFAADAERGFALIEDFGDGLFARVIPAGEDETELYGAAIDALLALRAAKLPPPQGPGYRMLDYDQTALHAETLLVVDWYWAFRKGSPPSDDLYEEYGELWKHALATLGAPSTLILRDYHAENLLWLPNRVGPARVGIIDFQDGLIGNPAYDLVSLLEDARRDVAPALADQMIARYCAGASMQDEFSEIEFRRDYALLGAQRNAKILGIFARLVTRDSKPRYADLLPRVERHFMRDLQHPELAAMRGFFMRHFPDRFS